MPKNLCHELVRSIKVSHDNANPTIIDLCSGYQSLKPLALSAGYNYIAVDIMGDRAKPVKPLVKSAAAA